MATTGKLKVLFVCTGNSARSQMAEAFLRGLGGEGYEVYSAGLEPNKGVNPFAIRVMEELGYDMSAHRAKHLSEYVDKVEFDYLITVCGNAEKRCPHFPGQGVRVHWGFEDPAVFVGTDEERLAKFREVRDLIQEHIRAWLDRGPDEPEQPAVWLRLPGQE
jgi:arsenate reductase